MIMFEKFPFERTQLYEKVWSKPLTEIAKEYGVSEKAIQKICDKLKVPIPRIGYWDKVEAGIETKRTPLPDIYPHSPTIAYLTKQEIPDYPFVIPGNIQRLIEEEKDPKNKIIVPGKRGKTHHLLTKTESSLRTHFNKNKFLGTRNDDGTFNLTVSPNEKARILRILNTLIIELEKRYYLVYIRNYSLCVKMYGIELMFGIKEKSKKIHFHDVNKYPNYDFIPTGIFTLSIDMLYSDYPIRKNFTDNRTGKIE